MQVSADRIIYILISMQLEYLISILSCLLAYFVTSVVYHGDRNIVLLNIPPMTNMISLQCASNVIE